MSFEQKLLRARNGLKPWERTPHGKLRAIGSTLSHDEVLQAMRRLDELSLYRDKLSNDPESNCDDTDEVHFQQEDIAISLRQCPPRAAPALLIGLESTFSGTRFWAAWALQYGGLSSFVPRLEQVLAAENDTLNRKVLATTITSMKTLSRGPFELFRRRIRALKASDA